MALPGVFKLNSTTGALVTSADLPYDTGQTVVVDTDGSIYIGTTGNYGRCLIKYNSSLEIIWEWDWWDRGQSLRSLTLHDGYIFCCGYSGAFKLDKSNGELVQYFNIYNTNPNPSDNPSFEPQEWEYDTQCFALVVNDDYVYLSHILTEIDGEDRTLTIFNHDGEVVDYCAVKDTVTGDPILLFFGLAVDTSYNIYVGLYYGTSGDYIIKLNSDFVFQWGYKTNSSTHKLKIIDGSLFAAGAWGEDEDSDESCIRKFNLSTGVKEWEWECYGSSVWDFVLDASNNIYIAGWLWDHTVPEEELNRYEKRDVNGNLIWAYRSCKGAADNQPFGYGICFDSTGNYVIGTGRGPSHSTVSKHWLSKYTMRYDSTSDKFKVNAEDNITKTSYKCKAGYWIYKTKKPIVRAEIENDYYAITYNPSADEFETTQECTILKKHYASHAPEDLIKLNNNIYFIERWGTTDNSGFDNLIKTDLDLTYVDSIKTKTGDYEYCRFLFTDETYIYTGADSVKQYNTSLELQWEFNPEGMQIITGYTDGTYLYFAGSRGTWMDNPSTEPDYQRGNVWKLNKDGELIWLWDSDDIGMNTTAYGIHGDSSGNIFVTFRRSNDITVVKLNSSGEYVKSYDTGAGSGYYCVRITINSDDDIFVSNGQKGTDEDGNYGDLRCFDTDLVNQWTISHSGLHILNMKRVDDTYLHIACRYKGWPDYNNYFIYKQSDGSLYKKYNLQRYPTCFNIIVDPDGEWVYGCGDGGTESYN